MRWNDLYRRGYSFEALFDIYGETIEFTFAFTTYHHGGRLGSQGGRRAIAVASYGQFVHVFNFNSIDGLWPVFELA